MYEQKPLVMFRGIAKSAIFTVEDYICFKRIYLCITNNHCNKFHASLIRKAFNYLERFKHSTHLKSQVHVAPKDDICWEPMCYTFVAF